MSKGIVEQMLNKGQSCEFVYFVFFLYFCVCVEAFMTSCQEAVWNACSRGFERKEFQLGELRQATAVGG